MADQRIGRLERRWLMTNSLEDLVAYERELERAGLRRDPEPEPVLQTKRDRLLEAELSLFVRQYGRKRSKGGGDPNDRRYDRRLERKIKRMDPWELSELLNGPQGDSWGEPLPPVT